MIEDERGFCSPEIFRRMFFTYFKGQPFAYQVFEMLLPVVTGHFDEENDQILDAEDPKATEANKVI